MITNLHIKNIGIIEDIEINFNNGFNVLTGETGAGKTLIIDSLKIIAGGRFSKEMIRANENHSLVEACIFYPNSDLAEDGNIIVSREIFSNGEHPKVILIETALHGEILNLQQEDMLHGCAKGESSRRINTGLAQIADEVLRDHRTQIAGMMLTGGDTMESVCRMIGTTYIKAIDNIVAQVDVGQLSGAYSGMPIVVKGGFCGYDEVGVDIVNRILVEANI